MLHAAAVGGNVEVLTTLLGAGAQPDVDVMCTYSPSSALNVAASCGHNEVSRILLEELLELGEDKCVLLQHAAHSSGHGQLVNDLLKGGADPNSYSNTGNITPLYAAARGGHSGVVSALLLAGADKNAAINTLWVASGCSCPGW